MRTLFVSLFGGPGIGKTTTALGVTYWLKCHNVLAEYVPEYAKQLVYDENWALLDGSMASQYEIFREQRRREERLRGKVEVAVTDSPFLLSAAYAMDRTPEYEAEIVEAYRAVKPRYNVLLTRSKRLAYQESGRMEDLAAAIKKDKDIEQLLSECEIQPVRYNAGAVEDIALDTFRELMRLRRQSNT